MKELPFPSEPFRLVPEQSTDGERIAAEREATAQAKVEAEKRQVEIPIQLNEI